MSLMDRELTTRGWIIAVVLMCALSLGLTFAMIAAVAYLVRWIWMGG